MEGEEEDCVVREVPVVFTRSHAGLHYLLQVFSLILTYACVCVCVHFIREFDVDVAVTYLYSQFTQYPLRPAWHDIGGSSVSSCKFKPIQQQLKIVVGTNVASPNIDLDHSSFPQTETAFNSVQVPAQTQAQLDFG